MQFDLEKAILDWRKQLRKHPGIEPGYADELESHLRDRIDDLLIKGMTEKEAYDHASNKMLGSVEALADEYYKTRGNLMRTPYWKRKDHWAFLPPNIYVAYIRQAIRSFQAAKSYFWINLLGLTLGLVAALILFKYVSYEWRTDKFHTNYDRIIISTVRQTPLSFPKLFPPNTFFNLDYSSFTEIEAATKINYYKEPISYEGKNYAVTTLVADSNCLKIFDFKLTGNHGGNPLADPTSMYLSRQQASKIFGDKDPIGEPVIFEGELFNVKGYYEPPAQQSSIQFDVLVSQHAKRLWERTGFEAVLISSADHLQDFNEKVKDAGVNHSQFPESTIRFVPLKEMYYNKEVIKRGAFKTGNIQYEWILLIIASLILGISLFNYLNLYAVILLKRSKEFGLRKVMGAGRHELFLNLFVENSLSSIFAVVLAGLLLLMFSNEISQFIGKEIFLDNGLDLWIILGSLVFITAITSVYPMVRLPRIHPIRAIKQIANGKQSLFGRKLLITTQFVITIGLIIVSLFFAKQFRFMLNKDLGFNPGNVVRMKFFPTNIQHYTEMGDFENDKEKARKEYRARVEERNRRVSLLINEIESNPTIQHLSYGDSPINTYEMSWKRTGEINDYHTSHLLSITSEFDKLYGLEIVEGRFFDPEIDRSRENKVVINEQAMKFFGIEKVGEEYLSSMSWGGDEDPWKVIGVVNDFAFEHLSIGIRPLVMVYFDDRDENHFMMRLQQGKEQEALVFLEGLFHEINPEDPFVYQFVDDQVKARYANDKKIVEIYTVFTLIALLISSLGLFGVSSYATGLRIKEIGIRKINGASVQQIVKLLTMDFYRYVLIAAVIACPIAAWAVMRYLENFAHQTSISAWVFVLATSLAFTIALATMMVHTISAARRNPVEALRYE